MVLPIQTPEDLREALDQKLAELKDRFSADVVTLHLYDSQRDRLYFPVGVGLLREQRFMRSMPSMDRVGGKIVRSREPMIANDAERHPDLTGPFTHVERIKSAAGFPLLTPAGEILGTVFVDYRSPHQFESDQIDTLQEQAEKLAEFVDQSLQGDPGPILQNALRMETDARQEEARLQEIVDRLWGILGDTDVALWTWHQGEQALRIKIRQGLVSDFAENVAVQPDTSANLVAAAFTDRESFLIEEPENDPRASFNSDSPVVWRCMLAVPILTERDQPDVLCAFRRERPSFTRQEEDLIEAFANLIGVTSENEGRVIALNALHDVGVRLTLATELEEILEEVVRSACQIFGADTATVHRYDPAQQRFYDLEHSAVFPSDARVHMEKPRDEGGLSARIIESGRIYSEDTEDRVDPIKLSTFVEEQNIKAYVGTPLVSLNEPLGVLYVSFKQRRRFPPEDLALIQILANYAATAIYRANLLDQRATVTEIAHDITSILDGDRLLRRTLKRSLDLLNCEFGSISVFDPTTELLHFRYAVGKSEDKSVAMGEGLIGTAADERHTIRVADVSQDKRYVEHISETQSELDVPMMVGQRLVGVLNAESTRLNAFSAEDQRLAEALAAQAAVAFRTAELYEEAQATLEERVEDIKALQDVFEAVGQEPLEKILERITQKAVHLTPAHYGNLWLLEDQHEELRFGNEVNLLESSPSRTSKRIPVDEHSINGWVALTGQSYLCKDVTKDDHYQAILEDVKSELAVPLKRGDRIIGTLNVESTELAAFTKDHQRLLEALAGQAAIAIDNARGYERLDTLATLGQTITSTLELDVVLERIMEQSVKSLAANLGTLRLLDDTTNVLELQAYRGNIGDRAEETIKLGEGIVGWVAEHGESDLVLDVQEDERYIESLEGTRCEIAVPIKVEGETIGVLNIEHSQPHAFDEHDLSLLEGIASQAANAIKNARLFYQRVQDISALVDINKAISSQDRDRITRLIVNKIVDLTEANYCVLMLVDESNQTLIPKSSVGRESSKEPLPIDDTSFTGWVASQKEADFCNDISQTEHYLESYEDAKSCMAAPMMYRGQLIGAIYVESPYRSAFSGRQLDLLQSFANQATIAIENARLFDQLERANEQLERKVDNLDALNEIGQYLTSSIKLSEEQILDRIDQQATQLMHTDNMYIALYNEETDTVRFPLMRVDGEPQHVEPRTDGEGRTEWIIQHQEPILIKTEAESIEWYKKRGRQEYIGEPFASWLGVPMMSGEKVLGVIATYHKEEEHIYDEDDLEVLQTIASQSAIALRNTRLVQELERTVDDLEQTNEELEALRELQEDLSGPLAV